MQRQAVSVGGGTGSSPPRAPSLPGLSTLNPEVPVQPPHGAATLCILTYLVLKTDPVSELRGEASS